jgi:hypothetical protein
MFTSPRRTDSPLADVAYFIFTPVANGQGFS